MNDFQRDMAYSWRFLPHMKRAIASTLITKAPVEEDMERNTDLVVLGMASKRIACRVRRNHQLYLYGDEFTVRCDRPSGMKTELDKIRDGLGDYFLYGFASKDENCLWRWLIADLNVFRSHIKERPELASDSRKKHNRDGTAFYPFRCKDFPQNLIVNSSAIEAGKVLDGLQASGITLSVDNVDDPSSSVKPNRSVPDHQKVAVFEYRYEIVRLLRSQPVNEENTKRQQPCWP